MGRCECVLRLSVNLGMNSVFSGFSAYLVDIGLVTADVQNSVLAIYLIYGMLQ